MHSESDLVITIYYPLLLGMKVIFKKEVIPCFRQLLVCIFLAGSCILRNLYSQVLFSRESPRARNDEPGLPEDVVLVLGPM